MILELQMTLSAFIYLSPPLLPLFKGHVQASNTFEVQAQSTQMFAQMSSLTQGGGLQSPSSDLIFFARLNSLFVVVKMTNLQQLDLTLHMT